MLGCPLVLEDGEVDLVAPDALEPLVAKQVSLGSHSQSVSKPEGGLVPGVHPGDHTVKAELVECQMEQGVGCLGGVAAAGVAGIEHPADLAASVLDAFEEQHHVPDHVVALEQLDPERERLTLSCDLFAGPMRC